jgi:hypothetical protein
MAPYSPQIQRRLNRIYSLLNHPALQVILLTFVLKKGVKLPQVYLSF